MGAFADRVAQLKAQKVQNTECARDHASTLANMLNANGFRAARAWTGVVGSRVYIYDQFVTVSWGGEVSFTFRGQMTFNPSALRRRDRQVFDQTMRDYYVQIDERCNADVE